MAFVKGRSVFHTVQTIDDILKFADLISSHGILVAIDFEKVFASQSQFFFQSVGKVQLWTLFYTRDKNILNRYFKLCYKQWLHYLSF